MDFDEIIRMLGRERESRLMAARINHERGLDIAEAKALKDAEYLRHAIKFFIRKKREQKRLDARAGSLL